MWLELISYLHWCTDGIAARELAYHTLTAKFANIYLILLGFGGFRQKSMLILTGAVK